MFGATAPTTWGHAVATVFGILGYFRKKYHYSRATLIIGLVLGRITEKISS